MNAAKSLAARRENWSRKEWRTSERGNAYINVAGLNITLFGSRRGWGIRIRQRLGHRCQYGRNRYQTLAEAKTASFEALLWAQKTWGGSGRYDLPATQGARP